MMLAKLRILEILFFVTFSSFATAALAYDSDADGISDYDDRCSGTPYGASVWTYGEYTGCAQGQYVDNARAAQTQFAYDSDSDGVADSLDRCPSTPYGAAVWTSGYWVGCAQGQNIGGGSSQGGYNTGCGSCSCNGCGSGNYYPQPQPQPQPRLPEMAPPARGQPGYNPLGNDPRYWSSCVRDYWNKNKDRIVAYSEAFLACHECYDKDLCSPLVLNFANQPITFTGEAIAFDFFGDGTKVTMLDWVQPENGFLVLDRNKDHYISSGAELFGSSTRLKDGHSVAIDGFAALAQYDENSDGVIDSADPVFEHLKVWFDGKSDGISRNRELVPLNALGVTKLNLAHKKVGHAVHPTKGFVGLDGTFEYISLDGQAKVGKLADVFFPIK